MVYGAAKGIVNIFMCIKRKGFTLIQLIRLATMEARGRERIEKSLSW